MKQSVRKCAIAVLAAAVPIALYAFSTGPQPRRAGVPADGGTDCSACHRITTAGDGKSDPRGSVSIEVRNYTPGIAQTIRVTVRHPEAVRWGFQLTARPVSDETRGAGTFGASEGIRVICDSPTFQTIPRPADGCPAGTPEFVEHAPAPNTGPTGSHTFDVLWTPPASEVGDIIFYAAGNAANGNGSFTGDRIYTTNVRVRAEGACTLTARPTLRSITDAASFRSAVSFNTLISLFGLGFQVPGNSRQAAAGDIRDNAFPKELGCIAVEVGGTRVPITYVQQDQINAQMPTTQLIGDVTVRVILNPDRPNQLLSDVATIRVTQTAPAFFQFRPSNSIAAQHASNFALLANPSVVAGATPAQPGETVILYLTGLGATNPVYQTGELAGEAARLRDTITLTIGGTTVPASDILYVGLVPGSISGLYQINVRLPATLADGDVPVVVRVGGGESQAGATIPVRR